MHVEVHDVEAQAVDTHVEPVPHDAEHRILHGGVVQVQVGLFDQEVVQVVLPPDRVPFPRVAAEAAEPVVGRATVGARVGPDVPVGLWVVAR